MSALLVNQGRISTGASASPSHRRRFKKSSVATNLGGGEERSSTRSRSSAVNTHGSASFQRLDDRDVAVGHGDVRWRRLATRPSRRVLRRADAAVPGPTTPEVAMSPSKLGWDTAMSASTLVQLGVCAATMVAEPVLGSIDTFWVAALGTTELSALGPNTTLYGCVIAVIVAYGFGTAATRKIAVALELDEAHRKSGTLKPGGEDHGGRHAHRRHGDHRRLWPGVRFVDRSLSKPHRQRHRLPGERGGARGAVHAASRDGCAGGGHGRRA
jgi:hypothetical protein